MPDTPVHQSTPVELQERLALEARGVPFLAWRDEAGGQVLLELAGGRLVVGRAEESDVALTWDAEVSRTHATLERVGEAWTVSDDGLSRNGTWVDGRRVTSRTRLHDGDAIRVGATELVFRAPVRRSAAPTVTAQSGGGAPDLLTPAQRRVVLALCRPYRDGDIATPASNQEIAAELSVSVEAVRTTMKTLFAVFGIGALPQNQKRAALAQQALRSGAVSRRDL